MCIDNNYVGITNTSVGHLLYFINDEFIGRSLQEYGEWCELENLFIDFLLSDTTGTVLDIGANIGYQTLYYLKRPWVTKVYAFEAHFQTYSLLVLNCTKIDSKPVFPSLLFAAHTDGSFQFNSVGYLDLATKNNFGNFSEGSASSVLSTVVPVVKLDAIFSDHPEDIVLIKIDVEGYESSTILSASEIIQANFPIVFYETNERGVVATRHLQQLGYVVTHLVFPAYRVDNFKNNNVDIWSGKGYSAMSLAIHKSSTVLLDKMKHATDLYGNINRSAYET